GEGQVAYHPHRGYFVAELSSADLVEVYRIRRLLEDEAVTAALPLLTDEDLAALQDALQAIEQADAADDIPAMTRANRSFHFLLIDGVGMPRLTRLIRQLWDATDAYRSMYFVEAENREQVRREHREIFAAVAARDLPRTLDLLHAHQDHAVERVSRVLGH
ncbi:MAG: GntR family transcriptional regulator, partial [Candidatus Nanopelagicales bacterium]